MSDPAKYSRRTFAKQSIGLGLLVGCTSNRAVAEALSAYVPKNFSAREFTTVRALMSRLIPADEKTGGAVEAFAHVYLDQALGAHHAKHREAYRNALAELDRWAQRDKSVDFSALQPDDMDGAIARLEKGGFTQGSFADGGVAFFNLIRKHTLEGFLSDPMYGGNDSFLGWRVIGYNGIQLLYSAEDQALNGRDEREARSVAAFGGSPMP